MPGVALERDLEEQVVFKNELVMKSAGLDISCRKVIAAALKKNRKQVRLQLPLSCQEAQL